MITFKEFKEQKLTPLHLNSLTHRANKLIKNPYFKDLLFKRNNIWHLDHSIISFFNYDRIDIKITDNE